MTPEIQDFLDEVDQIVFFSPNVNPTRGDKSKVKLPQSNDKLYIKTWVAPIIFDSQKKRMRLSNPLPVSIKAKVQLMAQCISKKKDEEIFHAFFKVNQVMIDDMTECAWSD